ncbi:MULTISPECIES: cell division protein FtsQ/DivIB [Dietzia]|uniref:Cell division protein FtsQ/DivIB n=1 Tax=Dietzia cinnamea TaxID=321318 RepID=A0AAW5QBD1_9ACTN|nr:MULTISPECIES: FtsQ-type POTRA domain-containing protein [Dietzia]KZO58014.1 cell division protein FtsQ [Dietzia maris]MBM7231214.1 FtsQ-type POTRA domain-containing protein [Dietzia cinnamea]MCT1640617.1 FtsQ-type POTRA domain-containing protein [Dietzia cinnamea]MCT1865225.1 FtsQ-type POTRA domain-containing protein [Dietzia cinnamea]MCT2031163.1 FtsQ-type POTRA domain-containing protein [Dietzia cinnamea]
MTNEPDLPEEHDVPGAPDVDPAAERPGPDPGPPPTEASTEVPAWDTPPTDDPDRRRAAADLRRSDERVRHSDPAVRARLRRRRRRTNRIYAGLGIALVVVLLGYIALYFLPVFAVREVSVEGTRTIPAEVVTERAAVAPGTPLLQVDTHAVARRVAGIPRVDQVTVKRDYPSGLRIELVERTALVVVEVDGEQHLVDAQGIDFGPGEVPPGTPVLTVGENARGELPAVVRDLATVFAEVRGTAGQEITAVEVDTRASIVLTLADGRIVEWGAAGRDREKAVALQMVLEQPGQIWNVSNPALPTSR